MEDFCERGELSMAGEIRDKWEGAEWVPFSTEYRLCVATFFVLLIGGLQSR